MSEDTLALMAIAGDRDDVRTIIAWLAAVNGRIRTIDSLVTADGLDLVGLARSWDGLDGHALCASLEKAFDELGLYERALE